MNKKIITTFFLLLCLSFSQKTIFALAKNFSVSKKNFNPIPQTTTATELRKKLDLQTAPKIILAPSAEEEHLIEQLFKQADYEHFKLSRLEYSHSET